MTDRGRRDGSQPHHLSGALQCVGYTLDHMDMRSIVLGGVGVIFSIVMLLAYLALSLAAHTALTILSWDDTLE
jgi:hypothetical protein